MSLEKHKFSELSLQFKLVGQLHNYFNYETECV